MYSMFLVLTQYVTSFIVFLVILFFTLIISWKTHFSVVCHIKLMSGAPVVSWIGRPHAALGWTYPLTPIALFKPCLRILKSLTRNAFRNYLQLLVLIWDFQFYLSLINWAATGRISHYCTSRCPAFQCYSFQWTVLFLCYQVRIYNIF